MQWSDTKNAGFTSGVPWIQPGNNYSEMNVNKTLEESDSVFNHYQQLIRLRKEYDVITYGDYQLLFADNLHVFVYTRNLQGETLLVVNNFYKSEVTLDLPLSNFDDAKVLLSNYPDTQQTEDKVTLRAYESIVYHLKQ